MTDEQILELAKSYGFDRYISKTTNDIYWECDKFITLECDEEDFLKFARTIYQNGYDDGAFENSEPSWLG